MNILKLIGLGLAIKRRKPVRFFKKLRIGLHAATLAFFLRDNWKIVRPKLEEIARDDPDLGGVFRTVEQWPTVKERLKLKAIGSPTLAHYIEAVDELVRLFD